MRVFGNNENDMQLTILEKHDGSLSLYNQDIHETSIQVTAKNLGDEKELLSFFMSDVIMTITNESVLTNLIKPDHERIKQVVLV